MKRALLPPLLVLALASICAAPVPSRAAEPLMVFSPPVAEIDTVALILRSFGPDAVFVGRTPDGMGFVLVSEKRGYFIRPQPGGIVRIVPADPSAVKDLVKLAGWAL